MSNKKSPKRAGLIPSAEGRLFALEQLPVRASYGSLDRVLLPENSQATEKLRVAAYSALHSGLTIMDDAELRRRALRYYETICSEGTTEYFDTVNLFVTQYSDKGLADVYGLLEKQRIKLEESAELAPMDSRRLYSSAILLTQAFPRTNHLDELVRIAHLNSLATIREGFKPDGFESVRNLAFELRSGGGATVSMTVLGCLYTRYRDFCLSHGDSWHTPGLQEVDPKQFARAVNDTMMVHRHTALFDSLITGRPCQYELDFGAVALSGIDNPLELVA